MTTLLLREQAVHLDSSEKQARQVKHQAATRSVIFCISFVSGQVSNWRYTGNYVLDASVATVPSSFLTAAFHELRQEHERAGRDHAYLANLEAGTFHHNVAERVLLQSGQRFQLGIGQLQPESALDGGLGLALIQ